MSLTFDQMVTEIKNLLDDTSTTHATTIRRYLNMAHDQVARVRDWPELMRRDFVALSAPYSTGTVSTSSATVTGVGSAWTTAGIDSTWKFAADYRSPWYEISTVGGETSITLADNFAETDLSGATYVLYKDTVTLPSDCNKLMTVWIHDTDRRIPLNRRDDLTMHGWGSYVNEADTPTEYMHIERNSTNNRMVVQVGPCAPDSAYRLEMVYRASVDPDVLHGDDVGVTLDGGRDELVLQRALYLCTRRDRARAAQELSIYNALLDEEWMSAVQDSASEFYLEEQRPATRIRAGERWRDLEG